jgi:hypothetical protein
MVALVFLPLDACDDGKRDPSSFGQAVKSFRFRAGREEPDDDPSLFERIFIGLYDTREATWGQVSFFDVAAAPPRFGAPVGTLGFDEVADEIRKTYDFRNSPAFAWADAPPEQIVEPVIDPEDDGN